jgi:hypothetical protein
MGVLNMKTESSSRNPVMRPRIFVLFLVLVSCMVFGIATGGFALQKYSLSPEEEAAKTPPATPEQPQPTQKPHAPEPGQAAAPGGHAPSPPAIAEQPKAPQPAPAHPEAKAPEAQHGAVVPGVAAEHGAEHGGAEHGVQLPEISPIAGVTFVDTVINLLDHELHGRMLGWRPNDLIIGRFTDNINNYQLGVLEAVRFTALRLKDSLTRMGDADTYDPDLEQAVNLLMNSATAWWWPSAESQYDKALEHLRKFKTKLEKGQRNFYYRRDNLVSLLATYKDLLGNVNRSLVMPIGWYHSDEHFYYAKGVAHVYYEILKVSRVGFKNQLSQTMHGMDIMDEVLHELDRAEKVDPWIVFDAGYGGFLANHRANLNAPLSEVAHLLIVLSQL